MFPGIFKHQCSSGILESQGYKEQWNHSLTTQEQWKSINVLQISRFPGVVVRMRVVSMVSISVCLNTWPSVGETVWKGLEDKVVGRGLSLGVEIEVSKSQSLPTSPPSFSSFLPLSTLCLQIRCEHLVFTSVLCSHYGGHELQSSGTLNSQLNTLLYKLIWSWCFATTVEQ